MPPGGETTEHLHRTSRGDLSVRLGQRSDPSRRGGGRGRRRRHGGDRARYRRTSSGTPATGRLCCSVAARRPTRTLTRRCSSAAPARRSGSARPNHGCGAAARAARQAPASAEAVPAQAIVPRGADRRHQQAAAAERRELGRVAQAVEGREGTTVQPLGDVQVDEAAEHHVLDSVGDPTGKRAGEEEPVAEPTSAGSASPRPWITTASKARVGDRCDGHSARDHQGSDRHPARPDREHEPVGDVAATEHVLDEEQLRDPDRRHEDQRAEGDDHREATARGRRAGSRFPLAGVAPAGVVVGRRRRTGARGRRSRRRRRSARRLPSRGRSRQRRRRSRRRAGRLRSRCSARSPRGRWPPGRGRCPRARGRARTPPAGRSRRRRRAGRSAPAAPARLEPPTRPAASATTAPTAETAASSRVVSTRSTSRPAWATSATDGPKRQIHSAATSSPAPVSSFTCSPSATIATQSPNADSPTDPATSRKSRPRSRLAGHRLPRTARTSCRQLTRSLY